MCSLMHMHFCVAVEMCASKEVDGLADYYLNRGY